MYCVDSGKQQQAKQQKGEWCGASGFTGYFHGECASGLVCKPDAWMPGAPNTCQEPGKKVCGSFGGNGEKISSKCGAGQVCSRVDTPCRAWAGECVMHCVDSANHQNQKKQQKGEWCGENKFTGVFRGDCASGLVCETDAWMPGTPGVCQKPGKKVGEQCKISGSASVVNGDCGRSLACVTPAAASNTSTTCQQMCAGFGAWGVSGACSAGKSCSCKAHSPWCQWTGQCDMYCC